MTTAVSSVKPPPRASETREGITLLGRLGLAGRTGFYVVLTGITIRIALFGGPPAHQADANGALELVSRPLLGKVAIAAVALGFVLFGVARLMGALGDRKVSTWRRAMTAMQGLFYVALAYVPCTFLAGNHQTGSQQQQEQTTARVLAFPGGQALVAAVGAVVLVVCAQQIRGALHQSFRDGLELDHAPRPIRAVAGAAGAVGISARALVFVPVGIFLIVAGVQSDPGKSYGTDAELLRMTGHTWGAAVLAAVAAGLSVFVFFSAVETRYRKVISAR